MSLTQREAFARLMEHMCSHDGDGGHGYSQYDRWGDGTTEDVDLGDGVTVTVAGGDRDCSSGIISCLKAVGVDTHGATYTGNMREELLKTGLFEWQRMGVASAKRGDIYLNEVHHTAMCTCDDPDMLAQFSRSETHGISGETGDQDGYESNIREYYSYPWDGKLVWLGDGETIDGDASWDADEGNSGDEGDTDDNGGTSGSLEIDGWWGTATATDFQRALGTIPDGVISHQWAGDAWRHEGCPSFEHDWTSQGSDAIRAYQQWANDNFGAGLEVDGLAGERTIDWTIDHWAPKSGSTVTDGKLSGPSITIKAIQSDLNGGGLR